MNIFIKTMMLNLLTCHDMFYSIYHLADLVLVIPIVSLIYNVALDLFFP